jgi:hypothetical protein
MKLYAVMRIKICKSSINLFRQLFLMHLIYVMGKISVVEYSYQSVNWIGIIRSNYINFDETICSNGQ